VEDLLGASQANQARLISLSTFHSQSARMLRREADYLPFDRDFVIFDSDDQRSLVKQAINDLNLDPQRYQPTKVLNAISSAKNELVRPQDYVVETYFAEIVQRVYLRYQELLLANNALDFDDLLFFVVRLLRGQPALRERYQQRFHHVLVDEFQDTNSAQYELLRLLTPDQPNLFVVGDADQSIYRWRGADYRNVHRFESDYPQARIILLEQNYRSTQKILDAATAVIDRLPGRKRKRLFTERRGGLPIVIHEAHDEEQEALFVLETIADLKARGRAEPGDCAIMYRTNAQSRVLEEAFLRNGLPYRLVGAQRFYGRREVRDVIAYLRLVHNTGDEHSLLRIINTPSRGIGPKTVEALLAEAAKQQVSAGNLLLALGADPDGKLAQSFGTRAGGVLTDFGMLLKQWLELAGQATVDELIERILQDTDYRGHLDDGTEEGEDRWENVLELKRVAEEFSGMDLLTFLEHVALVSDQDTLSDSLDAPVMMTLHAAKGLEFPVVFIVGLDEGVFPHQRSLEEPEELAEERRLFYVGITRAMDRLYLVRSFRRRYYGSSTISDPSRFLDDIPTDLTEGNWASTAPQGEIIFRRDTSWPQEELEPVEARYKAGMHVSHPTFGEGIVMESRVDHDDEEVVIAFVDEGIKHLLASMAPLEIDQEGGG
jgi:DNA helicase-2/ATP-dependent DNA helicase PcrA